MTEVLVCCSSVVNDVEQYYTCQFITNVSYIKDNYFPPHKKGKYANREYLLLITALYFCEVVVDFSL